MNRITNVLIFKDGFYWLTMHPIDKSSIFTKYYDETSYQIINDAWYEDYGIDKNGFEFASDAYAYIASLQSPAILKPGEYLVVTGDNKLPEWRDANEISPSNNTKVIVELEDGRKMIAWQQFGEWPDGLKVKRWRFKTQEPEYNDREEEKLKETGEAG